MLPKKTFWAGVATLLWVAAAAHAAEYGSVDAPAAVMYDTPSLKGKKLYLVKSQTPLEVLVRISGWVKVRDAEGSIAWMEPRYLSEQRTVMVMQPKAQLRQADQSDAPVLAEYAKWVVLQWIEPASPGWVKVKHRDGAIGYIRQTQVWGL